MNKGLFFLRLKVLPFDAFPSHQGFRIRHCSTLVLNIQIFFPFWDTHLPRLPWYIQPSDISPSLHSRSRSYSRRIPRSLIVSYLSQQGRVFPNYCQNVSQNYYAMNKACFSCVNLQGKGVLKRSDSRPQTHKGKSKNRYYSHISFTEHVSNFFWFSSLTQPKLHQFRWGFWQSYLNSSKFGCFPVSGYLGLQTSFQKHSWIPFFMPRRYSMWGEQNSLQFQRKKNTLIVVVYFPEYAKSVEALAVGWTYIYIRDVKISHVGCRSSLQVWLVCNANKFNVKCRL